VDHKRGKRRERRRKKGKEGGEGGGEFPSFDLWGLLDHLIKGRNQVPYTILEETPSLSNPSLESVSIRVRGHQDP